MPYPYRPGCTRARLIPGRADHPPRPTAIALVDRPTQSVPAKPPRPDQHRPAYGFVENDHGMAVSAPATVVLAGQLRKLRKRGAVSISAQWIPPPQRVRGPRIGSTPDQAAMLFVCPTQTCSRACRSISIAAFESGTRCSRPAFILKAGTVHVRTSKSISDHVASRTSPERAAVNTRNSNASFAASLLLHSRTAAIALATSPCGSACICFFGPLPFFGSTALSASPAGLSFRYPSPIAHFMIASMRYRNRFAMVGFVVHIGSITLMTFAVLIASTGRFPMAGKTCRGQFIDPLRKMHVILPCWRMDCVEPSARQSRTSGNPIPGMDSARPCGRSILKRFLARFRQCHKRVSA